MHSFVTSKNVKWCHLIWPTLYNKDGTDLEDERKNFIRIFFLPYMMVQKSQTDRATMNAVHF